MFADLAASSYSRVATDCSHRLQLGAWQPFSYDTRACIVSAHILQYLVFGCSYMAALLPHSLPPVVQCIQGCSSAMQEAVLVLALILQ